MKTIISLGVSFSLLFMGSSVLAQKFDLTPGLWEYNFKMSSPDGKMDQAMQQLQEQLASMPASQRKMMEDMFAAQGVGLGSSDSGTTIKICMTPEQIAKGNLPQQNDKCTQDMKEVSKNHYQMTFTCKGNPPSSGTGEVHFIDSKNYTGTSTVITESKGKKEVMNVSQTGKWLSTNCGKIKPVKP